MIGKLVRYTTHPAKKDEKTGEWKKPAHVVIQIAVPYNVEGNRRQINALGDLLTEENVHIEIEPHQLRLFDDNPEGGMTDHSSGVGSSPGVETETYEVNYEGDQPIRKVK